MKVFVFGPGGMLGHAVVRQLRQNNFEVVTVGRTGADVRFDAEVQSVFELPIELGPKDYVINCIGLISHLIDETSADSRALARRLNSELPNDLADWAASADAKMIQIATDCVFSGAVGAYSEDSHHDASDVYGLSKSAGEVDASHVLNLRCSIVGRELSQKLSLLEWVLGQPHGAKVPGFTDRIWNGITTLAFAKILGGILLSGGFFVGTQHVVPTGSVTKAELLSLMANSFDRADLQVVPQQSNSPKNLSLATNFVDRNETLWTNAGYSEIPDVAYLIAELAESAATIKGEG
jgi:dTDP-4-dehydrorhamnose reductase